jgi:hypothetical protein
MAGARQVLAALVVDELFNNGDSDSDEEEQRLARIPFTIQKMSERNLFQQTRLDRRVFNYVLKVTTISHLRINYMLHCSFMLRVDFNG